MSVKSLLRSKVKIEPNNVEGLTRNTVYFSPDYNSSLQLTIDRLADKATVADPWTIVLHSGTYDVPAAGLVLRANVNLKGSPGTIINLDTATGTNAITLTAETMTEGQTDVVQIDGVRFVETVAGTIYTKAFNVDLTTGAGTAKYARIVLRDCDFNCIFSLVGFSVARSAGTAVWLRRCVFDHFDTATPGYNVIERCRLYSISCTFRSLQHNSLVTCIFVGTRLQSTETGITEQPFVHAVAGDASAICISGSEIGRLQNAETAESVIASIAGAADSIEVQGGFVGEMLPTLLLNAARYRRGTKYYCTGDGNTYEKDTVAGGANTWGTTGAAAPGGLFEVGLEDTTPGSLYMYGGAAAEDGGEWRVYNPADQGGVVDYYYGRAGSAGADGAFRLGMMTPASADTPMLLIETDGNVSLGDAAATETLTLASSINVALNTPSVSTNQATVALFNLTATTVNAFGAATVLNFGAAAGAVTFLGSTMEVLDVAFGNALTVNGRLDTTAFGIMQANTFDPLGVTGDPLPTLEGSLFGCFSSFATVPLATAVGFLGCVLDPTGGNVDGWASLYTPTGGPSAAVWSPFIYGASVHRFFKQVGEMAQYIETFGSVEVGNIRFQGQGDGFTSDVDDDPDGPRTTVGQLHGGGNAANRIPVNLALPEFMSYYMSNDVAVTTVLGFNCDLLVTGATTAGCSVYGKVSGSTTTQLDLEGVFGVVELLDANGVSGYAAGVKGRIIFPDTAMDAQPGAVIGGLFSSLVSSASTDPDLCGLVTFLHCLNQGDAIAAVDAKAMLLSLENGTDAAGNIRYNNTLRVSLQGDTRYLLTSMSEGRLDFTGLTPTPEVDGCLIKGGVEGDGIEEDSVGVKFLSFYTDCGAASGESRGLYFRHYITGAGGGGECARFYTDVTDVEAGTGGVHGAHITLGFGDAGTCGAGLYVGVRQQIILPGASVGVAGNVYAGMSEIYGTASGSLAGVTVSAIHAFVLAGDETAAQTCNYVFYFDGLTTGTGDPYHVVDNPGAASHGLRVNIDGTTYHILLTNVYAQ